MMYLNMTPATNENLTKRFLTLLGVGFLQGCSLGPLIENVAHIDASIPLTALFGTALVFGCFSLAALVAKRRSFLYLGGFLGSALSLLFFGGLINMFFRSAMFFNVQLYGGLLLFSLFVIFDTQLVVEKHVSGDNDFIGHSLHLFLDFVAIFVRLMIILARNKENQKKERK